MAKGLNRFKILTWKNYILARRRLLSLVCEIVALPLLCCLFVVYRILLPVDEEPEMIYKSFGVSDSLSSFCSRSKGLPVAYSPNSPFVTKIVKGMCRRILVEGFSDAKELDKAINKNFYYFAAIQFDDVLSTVSQNSDLPLSLTITLRLQSVFDSSIDEWNTPELYPKDERSPRDSSDQFGGSPHYRERHFLFLQKALIFGLIDSRSDIIGNFKVELKRYPHPQCYGDDFYGSVFVLFMFLIILSGLLYCFVCLIKEVTLEKQKQRKVGMRIMGLSGWLYWLTWFIRTFIILLISIVVFLILVKIKFKHSAIFAHSDVTVLFVFLLLFLCCSITSIIALTVFFSNANMANFVALTFYFLSCIPGALHYLEVTTLTLNERIASSILPNSGLLFGITLILKFEVNKEGVQWSNLNNPPVNEDLFLGAILVMFAIGTLLYTIIALCAEIIYPGDCGFPLPYCMPSIPPCCGKTTNLSDDLSSNNHEENFEKFSGNLPIGIELRNLSKTYGSGLAINILNMTMYENHVTVLLGQDGTGKTTTISLISGIIPPSSGTAIVNGYDVRRDLKKARSSMGICLQHDILFDNLTVWENLYFFCQLKGLQNNESFAEANDFIQILEMKDKRNVVLKTLAEDMKRQLSVAIALCGKSKVVLLDEPTSLMDPSAKKKIWNMIQEQKRGCTIFLTTCNMDEAGLLGDRIAVMLDGEIICCGSSVFLKKKISIGYYLVLDVSPQCVPEKITELLSQYIPDIKIHSHTGPEITYQLSGKDSRKFPDMLAKLEGYDITQLGIRSFGISLSSLEEVISKGAADQNKKFSKDGIKPERTESNNLKVKYVDGCRLIINQVIAMLYKKFFSTLRAWPLLLSQIIITIALLLLALSSNIYSLYTNMTDELTIDLDKYQQPVILISGSKNTYYDAYKETLSKHEVLEVENISETILELVLHHLPPERKILIEILQTQNEPSTVKYRYIVGATFNPNKSITAWFNADAYHSTPLTLSLVLNTLYKVYVHAEKSVTFINHPMPLSLKAQMNDSRSVINSLKARNKIILLTWHLGFGVAFIAATFITFYIKERASKCKHLQFVSGIDAAIFWFTSLFCDLIIYFIIVGFIIAVFYVYQEQDFATSEELARLTIVYVCFGLFMLPFIYWLSHFFLNPLFGFIVLMAVGSATPLLGIIAMEVISLENNFLVAYAVHWILLFIPYYLFARGIQNLSVIVSLKEICSKQESLEEACSLTKSCCDVENYYSMAIYGIGGVILISVLMFVILSTILIINDNNFFNFVKTKKPVQPASIDGNVEKENKLIINSSERTLNNNYILIIRHLTKYYKARCVINGLCLGVKPHECFGVLSVGRDGKTTMFKMLTGDEHMSFGDIWVRGLNLKKHQKKVQKSIGFCPQVDPLLDDLTARETLKIFSLIRGVPYNQCKRLGETLAQEFDFYKYLDKKVKELSGGNKRKLSAAIALIGEPPVVYLDEPTEGMDSATKRYFWTIISKLREHGKCIVLTSRSLEECEALCTRIAVMVNGNFQYLGSAQRLKKKFAQDFDLTINVMKTTNKDKLKHDVAAIESFVKKHFSGAEPKEKYQELLSYQIPPSSMPWSKMFELLEENKKKLNIEDYSLGQCRSSYPNFHDVTF